MASWHQATVLAIFPFVLLAPLNGILSNSLPRRRVLVGASLYTLLALVGFVFLGGNWSLCLAMVAVGSAIYSSARFAVLPAAAVDARVPLPRVNGLFEMGSAAAIVGGITLGWYLKGLPVKTQANARWDCLFGLNLLCLLAALPVWFPSDVIRPEPWGTAVRGFFRDASRIFSEREACGSLLGLAAFQAIVTAGSGALVGQVIGNDLDAGKLLQALLFVGAGAALGSGLAGWQGNARRSPGLVPFGATGLLLALGWLAWTLDPDAPLSPGACLLLGFMSGLVNVPLRAAYMAAVPADARGNAMSVMNTALYLLIVALALVMLLAGTVLPGQAAQLGFLAVLTAAGVVLAWWLLLPQAIEQVLEVVLAPIYRVHPYGPGAGRMPERGPLLIVANHASYMDPFWIGKIVPRRVTPMMTSLFYDLPVIHWLMVHVVGAIRVPVATFRREAPELAEAMATLRAGGCVLVFPESILRRRDNQLLRPFGQGIWHVLRELPDTPVQACWIEGGWGSYMSYRDGPPMKNKRFDFWRRIRIGVDEARPLDPAVLVDHRTTRAYLMQAVLDCRHHLGLPAPAHVTAADGASGDEEAHAINRPG